MNAIPHTREHLVRIHITQLDPASNEVIDPFEKVIAGYDANFHLAGIIKFARHIDYGIRASFNVDSPGVSNNFDTTVNARRQNLIHQRHEISRIAGIRIARLLLLHDRHRDLGEIIQHQIIDWPAFYLAYRRIRQITPEALSGRNTNLLFHYRKCKRH